MELHHLSSARQYQPDIDDSVSQLLNGSSNTTYTNTSASTLTSPAKPRRTRTWRGRGRQSSIYIKRNRLSRYKEAVASILPIRLTQTSEEEMPLDTVGCCSNSSFFWTERFVTRAAQADDQVVNEESLIEEEFQIPSTLFNDSVEVNTKRLLGKFKEELQKKGSKLSMFFVIFRFCSTRFLISCLIHMLAILFEIAGIIIFLRLLLKVTPHAEPLTVAVKDENVTTQLLPLQQVKIIALFGLPFCKFFSDFLKSMTCWINLRTALRLRNGLIGATFKKVLRSKITYNISAVQLMSLFDDDSERLFNLLEQSSLLIGIMVGVVCVSIGSIILLGFPGIWPLFVLFPLLAIVILLARISSKYLGVAQHHVQVKMTLVEELCINFRNILMLEFEPVFKTQFVKALQMQTRLRRWSEIFSAITTGHLTSAMLIGGLYLNWCDVGIETDTIEVFVLIVLFCYLTKTYVIQFGKGVQAISDIMESLHKAKEIMLLEAAEQSKHRPRRELFFAVENALFTWPDEDGTSKVDAVTHLRVETFYVRRGDVVGLVGASGSGKTTFIHSLLGHTIHKSGDLRLKEKVEYYPEEPFLIPGTVKDNILFGSGFDGVRFYNAVIETKLNEDILTMPGFEDLDIMALDLTPQQVHRIVLARALYSDAQAIIFDEPLRNVKKPKWLCDIVQNVIFRLQIQQKTIVVVSSTKEFLEVCQIIHFIENGNLVNDSGTQGTFASFIEIPEYENTLFEEQIEESSGGFQERIEGANVYALALQQNKGQTIQTTLEPPISEPNKVAKEPTTRLKWTSLSALKILIVVLIIVLNTFTYFLLPFSFIQFHDYKYPWLAYGCVGIILNSILFDALVKVSYSTSCETKNRKYQTALFDKLLKTSLNFLQTTPITDVLSMFMMNFQPDGAAFCNMIYASFGIILSTTILCWTNYWTAIVVGVALIVTCIIYFRYRNSISYYGQCEMKARQQSFQLIQNLIKGRSVIQSTISESRTATSFLKRTFRSVECNSIAIFIQKSIIYHATYLTQLLFGCVFISTTVVLSITSGFNDSNESIFMITLGVFATYTLAQYTQLLMESLLYLERYKLKDVQIHQNLQLVPRNEALTQVKKQMISLYRGIPITIKNIEYKVAVRCLLKMAEMKAEPGDKVTVAGEGAHYVSSLLCRAIRQNRGEVLMGQLPILAYNESHLAFSFIPFDPWIGSATIAKFVDPIDINGVQVTDALKSACMWEFVSKLPKRLEEPVINLPRSKRQQLCIARCFIKRSRMSNLIIVIEYPHIELTTLFKALVNNELDKCTVIVLAGVDRQVLKDDHVYPTEIVNKNDSK